MKCYAHSRPSAPSEEWQELEDHLQNVACKAADFAGAFSSSQWGQLLGGLHDFGKARASFQGYLARANGIDDEGFDNGEHGHSGAGACLAAERFGSMGKILAYIIAGHHAGLPDWSGGENPNGALVQRLNEGRIVLAEDSLRRYEPNLMLPSKLPPPPWKMDRNSSDVSFWIRMLYSCLVDADFLDTEAFVDNTIKTYNLTL
jgi:CRISPR-associated endonuclease/helicase Cas3